MSPSRRQFLKWTTALTAVAKSGWQPRILKSKPNIIIAVLDDVGFGDLGCYGSEVPTACMDALASAGARFNNFHVTALCAPTRASLLTGRNAHAAGVGNIAEWGRDHPGYRGWIRDDVQTLPEILGPLGYRNYAVGKWHLSTVEGRNATGPYDQWPTGRGFDHWYGFLGAAANHWHPELFRNRGAVYPDKSKYYHLTDDLIDQSIKYLKDHAVTAGEDPFFLYLAFGACHFPYHVPDDYMQRHRGRYDVGWDEIRSQRFEQQKKLGIVPQEAELSPRNADVPEWSGLGEDVRRFSARTQEAYAAFLHHTDDQLQRLVDFLERSDQLDNTILIVMSDNGAGSWAPPAGRLDVHRVVYIESETIEELTANIDLVGTEDSQPSYSPGWAQVSNTPLKYYKADTHEGGIRAPFIVHWPAGDQAANSICSQYHHVTDVVPTLLELINAPKRKLDGVSMAYVLATPDVPTVKVQQYYETAGDRAIWIDGWKAVTRHQANTNFDDDYWALYHSAADFAEIHDLAARYPRRLADMQAVWFEEAENNYVLPLEADILSLERGIAGTAKSYFEFYPGMTRIERRSAPDIYNYDYQLVAKIVLSDDRASGVLLASGDSMAGYELIMRDGYIEYTYIYTRSERYAVRSDARVPAGSHEISLRSHKTGEASSELKVLVDGQRTAILTIPKMWEVKSLNAGVRCGENRGAPISKAYAGPFKFTQELTRLTVALDI